MEDFEKQQGITRPPKAPTVSSESDAVRAVTAKDGADNDAHGANGTPEEHTFALDFMDSRGRRWTGQFKSRILSIEQRVQVGLIKSRLAGGAPLSSLDDTTQTMLEMRAHLAMSLTLRPKWANDLGKLRDVQVLTALYAEVAQHEARFWGSGEAGTG